MPSNTYQIGPENSPELVVSWKGYFNDFNVELSGLRLLHFANRNELRTGKEATLPDGRTLQVRQASQSAHSLAGGQLDITIDGKPVAGSAGDPESKIEAACGVVYFLALLNGVLGLAAWTLDVTFLRELGLGWASVLIGLAFASLAPLVKRNSMAALAAAMAIVAIDVLITVLVSIEFTKFPIIPLIVKLALLGVMAKALPVMHRIRRGELLRSEKLVWSSRRGLIAGIALTPAFALLILGLLTTDSAFHASGNARQFDLALSRELEELSKQLPIAIDDNTHLEAAWMERDAVYYRYRMPQLTIDNNQIPEFKTLMTQKLVSSQCNNPALLVMLENDKTIHFRYVDQPGTEVAEILFEKSVCLSS